jgi:hypothetical protein
MECAVLSAKLIEIQKNNQQWEETSNPLLIDGMIANPDCLCTPITSWCDDSEDCDE